MLTHFIYNNGYPIENLPKESLFSFMRHVFTEFNYAASSYILSGVA